MKAQAATQPTTQRHIRNIFISSIGNLIEWYDVYAYTAFSFYFAQAFFPKQSVEVQQLNAAVVFAVAFLARPLGGIVFGYIADRFGRRNSLTISILLMCFGSFLIAVTPSYASIGMAAPILLALARVLQAISQGGEYGASTTYFSEVAPPHQRGFYSGVYYVTLTGGSLCAVIVLLLLQKLFLTPEELTSWGWRIPFILGAVLSLYGFYMRRHISETDHFTSTSKLVHKHKNARWQAIRQNWKAGLLVIGITIGGTSAFYTYSTYMQKFLKLSAHFTEDQVTMIIAGALVFAIMLQPLYGALSDKIGRKPLLLMFGILGTLGTVPMMTTLQTVTNPLVAFLLICLGWMVLTGYTSVAAIVKAELFPTAVRAMGVGIPYALTVALFGGTVDSIALLFKNAGIEQGFYWYASGCILISLIVYSFLPDTKQTSLMEKPV